MRTLRLASICACLLAVMTASLAAHAQRVEDLDKLGGERIVEIRIEGNQRVEAEAIRQSLRSVVGGELKPEDIARDIKAVYGMGLFRDVVVERENVAGGVVLIFRVVEKPSIWSITFEGNDKVSTKDLEGAVDIKPFSILDRSAIARNVEKLRDLYAEKGFFLAEVTYRLKEIKNNRVVVVFKVRENRKVQVKKIHFLGNSYAQDSLLKRVMQTKEGGALSWLSGGGTYREDVFAGDVELISSYYLDNGFINVRVDAPRVALSRDRRHIFITININEGDQYKIGKVELSGDLVADADELKKKLKSQKGEFFSRSKIGQDIVSLTERYSDDGYAFANVYPLTEVDNKAKTIDVKFEIQQGQKVYIERINITGNTITRDKVIRRELEVTEGELFSGTSLRKSRENLMRLGFFEDVAFSTPRGSKDNMLQLNIEAKEKPTGIFSIGAGFSSAENFVFTAQIAKNNFLGRGYNMSAQMELSSLRQRFTLSFVDPFFLDSEWTFGTSLYNRSIFQSSFSRLERGGRLTFGHYVGPRREAQVSLGYQLQDVQVRDISEALRPLFQRQGLVSSVVGDISWDRRDNRLFPTKGFYSSLFGEYAGGPLGGNTDFFRTYFNARGFYPLPLPLDPIFRANMTLGWIVPTTGEPIPIQERFRAGGINSVRGYRLNSLGPTQRVLTSGDPAAPDTEFVIGGTQLGILNLEVEFPLIKAAGIRGVLFTDAGNAFAPEDGFDLTQLRYSYGFGFRWFSPIGPLRFEWGFPIDPRPGEKRQFEFTIGSFF